MQILLDAPMQVLHCRTKRAGPLSRPCEGSRFSALYSRLCNLGISHGKQIAQMALTLLLESSTEPRDCVAKTWLRVTKTNEDFCEVHPWQATTPTASLL